MAVEGNSKDPSLDQKSAGEFGNDEKDDICIPLAKLYEKLSRSSNSFIFKVPHQLRQVKASAYDPQIISIGPYHRGKPHLMAMEMHKSNYLRMLLQRRNEDNGDGIKRYVDAMRDSEDAARTCYAESLNMSSQKFVQMLVLDGCFVIEQFRRFASDELRVEGDDLFKLNFYLSIIGQELLLVENQLPFFVLEKLFNMTKTPSEDGTLVEMALRFFSGIVPGPGIRVVNCDGCVLRKRRQFVKHLIGFVHDTWLPLPEGIKRYERLESERKWNFIRSARELSEVGIKFKKVIGDNNSLFDIKFDKHRDRFHIPTLTIYHHTERILRNLIAYEQFTDGPTYVMDYARFMNCLINYGDDVALPSRCGIIVNWLGSDEEVACMFNKLNDFVYLSTANFYYSEIFNDVNNYCRSPWTKCKVTLRNKYFSTPWDWALASIVAGIILLLLTFVQTMFTVLSYF